MPATAAEAVLRAQTGARERNGRPPILFEPLVGGVACASAGGERLQAARSRTCKHCEFYCDPIESTDERRSGWAECMEAYFRCAVDRPRSQTIFGLYDQADIDGHLAARRLRLADLEEADLGMTARSGKISRSERHVLQWREVRHGDRGIMIREDEVRRALREEVLDRAPADAGQLIAFLAGLGLDKDSRLRMLDLGRLMADQVFLPGSGGSSSMKRFLPAMLRECASVRMRYAAPVSGTDTLPSLNFERRRWVVEHDGELLDPYRMLDPVFDDPDINHALEWIERSEGGEIANGAAAMIAYAMLQDPTVGAGERARLERQLKRCCELDTLAMVMVYEALREWILPLGA